MLNSSYKITRLNSALDRTSFNSNSLELNHYFQRIVTQDIKRKLSSCFVLINNESNIIGYYTLSAASIPFPDLPSALRKKLPRYPSVPAIKMRRLAVDRTFCGQGFGGILLIDALKRSAATEIGAYALIVDAKDQQAAKFYQHYGFITLLDSYNTLLYPLSAFK